MDSVMENNNAIISNDSVPNGQPIGIGSEIVQPVLGLSAPHQHSSNVALVIGSDGRVCPSDCHCRGLETNGQTSTALEQRCTHKRRAPADPSESGSSDEVEVRDPGIVVQEVQGQQRRARMMRSYVPGPPLPPGFRLAELACAADPRRNLHNYQTVRSSWDWATRSRTNRAALDERRAINLARARRNRLLSQVPHNSELVGRIGPLFHHGREGRMILNNSRRPDVYRDLRLDVANMTHEELIALQERIGDVNTGLTEEIVVERLRWREYQSSDEEDSCAICLENYIDGDELGLLDCQHKFHLVCVKQWLRVKNICPICKITALAE